MRQASLATIFMALVTVAAQVTILVHDRLPARFMEAIPIGVVLTFIGALYVVTALFAYALAERPLAESDMGWRLTAAVALHVLAPQLALIAFPKMEHLWLIAGLAGWFVADLAASRRLLQQPWAQSTLIALTLTGVTTIAATLTLWHLGIDVAIPIRPPW